jgi:hypothetical protein
MLFLRLRFSAESSLRLSSWSAPELRRLSSEFDSARFLLELESSGTMMLTLRLPFAARRDCSSCCLDSLRSLSELDSTSVEPGESTMAAFRVRALRGRVAIGGEF